MTDIETVLTGLGMSQYTDRFRKEGFDTWKVVMDITEPDMAFLGINFIHRKRLQREISKAWSNLSIQDSLPYDRTLPRKDHEPRQKRTYRHRPKADLHGPKRPLSAYTRFARHIRSNLKHKDLSFVQITRHVGESWQLLNDEKKTEWKMQAALAKRNYFKELEKYKQTQDFNNYQQYLVNFKRKYIRVHPKSSRESVSSRRSSNTSDGASSGSWSMSNGFSAHPNISLPSNLLQPDMKCDHTRFESTTLRRIPCHPDQARTLHIDACILLLDSSQNPSELTRDKEKESEETLPSHSIHTIPMQSTILPEHQREPCLPKSATKSPQRCYSKYNSISEYLPRQSYFETVLQLQLNDEKP